MNYLLWSLPMLVIAGAIAIARLNATQAAALGLLATVPVAIYAGDTAFGGAQLALALERGAWIGATIAPYILGGLLFWQAAARASAPADGSAASPADARDRRRLLFFACFLVGPFAEAATGFGVGMLGTVALLRGQHRAAPPDGLRAVEPDADPLGRDEQRHAAGLGLCAHDRHGTGAVCDGSPPPR